MSLDVVVDLRSGVPPYEQIRGQVAAAVTAGLLAPGAHLPTIRALAAGLGVATGTVARAYAELEAAGLVTRRRRTGTVVTAAVANSIPAEERVRGTAARLVAEAREAGLPPERVLALVQAALLQPAS